MAYSSLKVDSIDKEAINSLGELCNGVIRTYANDDENLYLS